MKIIYLFAASILVSCAASRQANVMSFAGNPVVAHRGAFKKNNLPENSIAALKEAIRLRCTGSEFDVRMSADDSLVINHDPKYKEMEIEKTLYKDLTRIKFTNGETLPTLHQFITAGLQGNKATRLVVEIKPTDGGKERARLIADKVVKLIRDLNAEHMVVYISFDYDILKRVIELDPKASTQYLNGDYSPEQLKADRINGADYNISVFRKHPEWIPMAKQHGIILNAWTVNTESDMKWLISEKFDFITTNEPELLLSLLSTKK